MWIGLRSQLTTGMLKLKDKYDIIGDVRGHGFMQAIELVKDHKTREPAPEATAKVFEHTRANGLIMSKSGTFKNVLRMVPPICLSANDVEPVLSARDQSFADLKKSISH